MNDEDREVSIPGMIVFVLCVIMTYWAFLFTTVRVIRWGWGS